MCLLPREGMLEQETCSELHNKAKRTVASSNHLIASVEETEEHTGTCELKNPKHIMNTGGEDTSRNKSQCIHNLYIYIYIK